MRILQLVSGLVASSLWLWLFSSGEVYLGVLVILIALMNFATIFPYYFKQKKIHDALVEEIIVKPLIRQNKLPQNAFYGVSSIGRTFFNLGVYKLTSEKLKRLKQEIELERISELYECKKCGKEFDSEKKAEKHEKQCKK